MSPRRPLLSRPSALVRLLAMACLSVLALAGPSPAQDRAGKTAYSDPGHHFRLAYPSGWRRTESTVPYTVLAVDNGGSGAGRQTVSVRVYALEESNYADPAEFVFQFLSGVEEGGGLEGLNGNHPLKDVYPDIRAVEYGETSIGGSSAFYVLSRYQAKEEGGQVPWSIMQIVTMHDDNVFELAYGARQSDFQQQRQSLAAIADTFAFE